MNASKEFAESNMLDSVNKYLDKTADALKEAEKHEAEAQKLLDKK
jgi:ABC-type nitrate/sulfonate/bicarbonate transport system substrate-binding protein